VNSHRVAAAVGLASALLLSGCSTCSNSTCGNQNSNAQNGANNGSVGGSVGGGQGDAGTPLPTGPTFASPTSTCAESNDSVRVDKETKGPYDVTVKIPCVIPNGQTIRLVTKFVNSPTVDYVSHCQIKMSMPCQVTDITSAGVGRSFFLISTTDAQWNDLQANHSNDGKGYVAADMDPFKISTEVPNYPQP
jgi:hypothetical protein